MDKFLNLLTGTTDIPTYMAGFLFALIGLAFYHKGNIKKGINAFGTPDKFSLRFFIQDNIVDMFFSVLGILILLRFSNEYADVEVTMIYAVGIGYSSTLAINKLFSIQSKARK